MPFENQKESFITARDQKIEKYKPVREHLLQRYKNVSIEAVVVGPLGTWDPPMTTS